MMRAYHQHTEYVLLALQLPIRNWIDTCGVWLLRPANVPEPKRPPCWYQPSATSRRPADGHVRSLVAKKTISIALRSIKSLQLARALARHSCLVVLLRYSPFLNQLILKNVLITYFIKKENQLLQWWGGGPIQKGANPLSQYVLNLIKVMRYIL